MKRLLSRPRALPCLIAAAACFALACFFRFALIGYGTLALCFAGLGAVILSYLLLPKALKTIVTILLCAGAMIFAAAEIQVLSAARGDADAGADYLIVLGAGVNGAAPSLSMLDRLRAAKAYLDAHPGCVAVVSGGQGPGEEITEAEAMFRWLTANGIGEHRIILEDRAASTLENLRFSFDLIPDAENRSVAVASSEYHLYRAEYLARQLGYTVSGVPARTSLPVLKLNYFIREAFGVVYYQLRGAR